MASPRIQYALLRGTIERHIADVKGKKYAHLVMQKSKQVYRYLLKMAPEIGSDNPFQDFFAFCLCILAPYQADDKKIDPDILGDAVIEYLYFSFTKFKRVNLKTKRGREVMEKALKQTVQYQLDVCLSIPSSMNPETYIMTIMRPRIILTGLALSP